MNTESEKNKTENPSYTELQRLLHERVDSMIGTLITEFTDKAKASNALVLSDKDLFGLLYSTILEQNARTPDRVLQKLKRRSENLSEFFDEIEKLGGVIKAPDVASILDISRQAVNLRVKANKLLAFKKSGDYVFPAFQFTRGGVLPHFENLMKSISSDIGPVSRISFLTTPLGGKNRNGKTPLMIMQEDGSADDISNMLRAAKQMGEQIAS